MATVANQNALFVTLMDRSQFFINSLCLQVAPPMHTVDHSSSVLPGKAHSIAIYVQGSACVV